MFLYDKYNNHCCLTFFFKSGVSDNDICSINIPSGIPFVYEFDDDMKVLSSKQFLGDKKRIEEGIARAASIGSH